jgi:hypothetical protein
VEAFSRYRDRLVADGKNVGECGVLAMGKIYGCELVMDDAVPRQIAEDEGIKVAVASGRASRPCVDRGWRRPRRVLLFSGGGLPWLGGNKDLALPRMRSVPFGRALRRPLCPLKVGRSSPAAHSDEYRRRFGGSGSEPG